MGPISSQPLSPRPQTLQQHSSQQHLASKQEAACEQRSQSPPQPQPPSLPQRRDSSAQGSMQPRQASREKPSGMRRDAQRSMPPPAPAEPSPSGKSPQAAAEAQQQQPPPPRYPSAAGSGPPGLAQEWQSYRHGQDFMHGASPASHLHGVSGGDETVRGAAYSVTQTVPASPQQAGGGTSMHSTASLPVLALRPGAQHAVADAESEAFAVSPLAAAPLAPATSTPLAMVEVEANGGSDGSPPAIIATSRDVGLGLGGHAPLQVGLVGIRWRRGPKSCYAMEGSRCSMQRAQCAARVALPQLLLRMGSCNGNLLCGGCIGTSTVGDSCNHMFTDFLIP